MDFTDLKIAGKAYSDAIGQAVMVKAESWRFRRDNGTHWDSEGYRVWSGGVEVGYEFDNAEETLESLRIKTLLHRQVAL